ncbi:MAG: metalloregulator ArsR/SmtB family transcription factor [Clostridia bacterium]|nr:metalloregulator ArsR/SmtB family transcription factor [Clostridia bacterium]
MTETEALTLFKCLADKSRLQILKSLAQEDMYVERLAERLGLTPPTISFHLKKLSEVGAVRSYKTQYYTMYALQDEVFRTTILELLMERSDEADLQAQRDEAYRQKVLKTFFEYGKLRSIPTQKKKERIVLEEIVRAFEPGRRYTEREVNIILADYHDDFCTLRRDMIGEKLMQREQQVYWRTASDDLP